MRTITKIRRSVRAISPIISVLLMIAIVVIAALVVYAWVAGYIGFHTSTAGKAIRIQGLTVDTGPGNNLDFYVQNIGQGSVNLNPTSSVYVNGTQYNSNIQQHASSLCPLAQGQTVIAQALNCHVDGTTLVTVKVVTIEGTFAQLTGYPTVGTALAPPPTDSGGATPTPTGSGGPTPTPTGSGGPTPTPPAGTLDHFTITAPASVASGTSFGSVTVTAFDSGSNVLTGYTGSVYFTSSDTAATLPFTSGSKYTFVSSDYGAKTFSGFTLRTTGSQSITVTDGSKSAVTNPLITVMAPLDHFTITGYPTSVTAGQSFGGVVVTAYAAGNVVLTGYTGSVYFTSTDTAATLPFTTGSRYTFTAGDSGVHMFSGFTLNNAGSRTITVTDGTVSVTTTTITVTNPSSRINYNTAISPTSALAEFQRNFHVRYHKRIKQ